MKSHRFCLNPALSPAYYNLQQYLLADHWTTTRYAWWSDFNATHFEFDLLTAQQLEYKHLLTQLAQHYCPHTMPLTYPINDSNWQERIFQLQRQPTLPSARWILKPSLLNNGQHIKIFDNLASVTQHYSHNKRLGGEHVLQHYIDPPHLLKQHKYSIRMFVILTNYDGAFLYPHGYYNVAKLAYDPHNLKDLLPHLTNEHLYDSESNVIQIPTSRFDNFSNLYPPIKAIIQQILSGLQYQYPQSFICHDKRKLAIFGFDFLVDANLRTWLLEANHGPCFPIDAAHPLQTYLYSAFWQDFISSFVRPIATKQKITELKYSVFERIV